MKERWNHPCVVIWDAQKRDGHRRDRRGSAAGARAGPLEPALGERLRPPQAPGDVIESHPYHFQDPHFTLAMLARESGEPRLFEAQVAAAKTADTRSFSTSTAGSG